MEIAKLQKIINRIVFRLKTILRRIKSIAYVKFRHNPQEVLRVEEDKFERTFLYPKNAEKKLNKILMAKYGRTYDQNQDSVHWLLFSALSNEFQFKKILEIGTYDGEFTNILGQLFPDAAIKTVDLPDSDPIVASSYDRADKEKFSTYSEKQSKNTKLKNVTCLKTNTLFLLSALEDGEKFDLIWVDGGHLLPDVAWDICNAYYLLNEGGFMLCDDVILSNRYYNNKYVSTDSWEVLKYLEERIEHSITYFLKRMDPYLYSHDHSRKYVALLAKKEIVAHEDND